MRTKVTKYGQVSVPSQVRKQLRIAPGTALEWAIEGATARVILVPADPIKAFRASDVMPNRKNSYRGDLIFSRIVKIRF
jgi:AbrB family looped-hinge helix DNA binding protein